MVLYKTGIMPAIRQILDLKIENRQINSALKRCINVLAITFVLCALWFCVYGISEINPVGVVIALFVAICSTIAQIIALVYLLRAISIVGVEEEDKLFLLAMSSGMALFIFMSILVLNALFIVLLDILNSNFYG